MFRHAAFLRAGGAKSQFCRNLIIVVPQLAPYMARLVVIPGRLSPYRRRRNRPASIPAGPLRPVSRSTAPPCRTTNTRAAIALSVAAFLYPPRQIHSDLPPAAGYAIAMAEQGEAR